MALAELATRDGALVAAARRELEARPWRRRSTPSPPRDRADAHPAGAARRRSHGARALLAAAPPGATSPVDEMDDRGFVVAARARLVAADGAGGQELAARAGGLERWSRGWSPPGATRRRARRGSGCSSSITAASSSARWSTSRSACTARSKASAARSTGCCRCRRSARSRARSARGPRSLDEARRRLLAPGVGLLVYLPGARRAARRRDRRRADAPTR
jgi:hypothetical protein